MESIVDKIISTNFEGLNDIELEFYKKIGLIVNYKNCRYEFFIHLVDFDKNIVILGSSFLNPHAKIKFKNRPYFERQSWFEEIKHNVIYYNDPTLYDYEELDGGWGIGTPDNWHLENISQIIMKLADKLFDYDELRIPQYGNLFFYGNSMGGFMSIILSILIKNSTSIADSPQFNLFTWWYWKNLKLSCFKDMSDEEILQYSYKLDVIDLINRKNKIPNSFIVIDCSDQRDWETQNRYFLNKFGTLPYQYNSQGNKINLQFIGKCIGHNLLLKNETINLIDKIITSRNEELLYKPNLTEMLIEYKSYIQKLYNLYTNQTISFENFCHHIKNYNDAWNFCRVDVKNMGKENNAIEILEKDSNVNVNFPEWFSDNQGKGCTFSAPSPLNIKIKCINDGNLSIIFRGADFRHVTKNQKRVPVYLCYNNLKINNRTVLSKDSLVWHDRKQTFEQTCGDNEIIDIGVEFKTIHDYFPELRGLINSIVKSEEKHKMNYDILIDYLDDSIEKNNLKH